MATGLETNISCLCLCQRIPVVKNMKAEELSSISPYFPISNFILIFPTELNSGEDLLGFYYLSRIKLVFLLCAYVVGTMGDRREA